MATNERGAKLQELAKTIQAEDAERERLTAELAEAEKAVAEHEYGKLLKRRDVLKKALEDFRRYQEGRVIRELKVEIRERHVPEDLRLALEAVDRELADVRLTHSRACGGVLKTRFAPQGYEPRIRELREAQQAIQKLVFVENYQDELMRILDEVHLMAAPQQTTGRNPSLEALRA